MDMPSSIHSIRKHAGRVLDECTLAWASKAQLNVLAAVNTHTHSHTHRGDEAPNLIAFKDALGLNDEEAAMCHVDVARRLYRLGAETRDRDQQFEQKKGFQRLVYVSQAVFGDVAAYLLSWRSHFALTEAQLYVARRDNAKVCLAIGLRAPH